MTNLMVTPSPAFSQAVTAYNAGKLAEAEQICQQIISAQSDLFNTLHLLAVAQSRMGKRDAALASYNRALAVQPDNASALTNRGAALHELKRFDEALASYDHALAAQPDYAEAFYNRGITLKELKRFEEALASYDRAVSLRPDYYEALYNRGNVLQELKRFEEALASYDNALKVRPGNVAALINRGNSLRDLKRFEEALASNNRALAARPDYAVALSARGVTLAEMKRFEEALASYDRAVTIQPDYAEAHYNESLCLLLTGDFERGWRKHEWRWKTEQLMKKKRNYAQPLWLGSGDIAGKTILLHAEQGFGDTIQFCRYVPLVANCGARVILEVPRPLHALLTTLAASAHVVSGGDLLPDFDMHCPLLSLPLAFGTRLDTIPQATPYLSVSSSTTLDWMRRIGPKRRPWIGLAWSGNPAHKNDYKRSIRLNSLRPLLELDATFIGLQKDVRAEDPIALNFLHFGDSLGDFSETAALISNLDLIVSVDTSVAHLAGALAKPTWILLPFVPDWRWLLERNDSPWYSTVRLFRQDDTREWDNVITRVHAALREFACIRGSTLD